MELLKSFRFKKSREKEKEAVGEHSSDNAVSEPFSLPSPIPEWPPGGGFAEGNIQMGELTLMKVTKFQKIWSFSQKNRNENGATFYKPIDVPSGFFLLGHCCHQNNKPLHGFALAVRESTTEKPLASPAIQRPVDYVLIWKSSSSENETGEESYVYFWVPSPPEGYQAMGFLVTKGPDKPLLDEIACVRTDLTDRSEVRNLILDIQPRSGDATFQVWNTRPAHRGMQGQGIPTGTFFCSANQQCMDDLNPVCLKNANCDLHAMPNLEQIHALIQHYGPMVFFHPKEKFLPSSVSWFFKNGAALYTRENSVGETIDVDGANLPAHGHNDGQHWIDLPNDTAKGNVKFGNLDSAELYCHIKPALGGTFTDIAMWVFCPFNGPGTLKLGMLNIPLGKIGQHVGDWEHFTLRIDNFDGVLSSIYYSQHSGGVWVDTPELEFITGNKAAVYSSKYGHASYPHAGLYLQGSQKLGIGIRNDAARSDFVLDSSRKYQIVAANYLGDDVVEPHWLKFMREWGPTVIYRSRINADRIIGYLPLKIKCSLEKFLNKLPCELCKEEGPTGPKEKNNWLGDERC
ncbi:vacuolar sorting-associated protein (DUF946) [Rhynchospora pubera]|uniref:Vacuolar sorting-associated protein (DUF946) n=1 Tax=Rhynchospora pubera TaxID=906938 RepID=A0AAV8EFZ7_9POAL|nr:vacuolar sorting-associated protein (DUF946) [Rhynchospora pubera]